ncbi:tRNA dihydrouridine synthase DusB [bacterium]|nr:tRNA dihydrouridine synthase DusB [bacterium]
MRLASRVLMAPMMGYNERAMRRIFRRFGSGLALTEMIKPEKLLRGDADVIRGLDFGDDERPLGAQICGRDPEPAVAAALALRKRGYDLIDLNMGCPLKKEVARGRGAQLLREPEQVRKLVSALVSALDCPLTVKVRAGWEPGEITAPEIARIAVECGACAVTVHGRTKMGWYREKNDRGVIRAVREALPAEVPVIGNGDVVDLASAVSMFEETACDAVMIGRGAVGNPWLFRRVNRFLETGEVLPEPTFSEVRQLFSEHMAAVQEMWGEKAGYRQVRLYSFYYFGRFPVPLMRARLGSTRSCSQLFSLLDDIEREARECGVELVASPVAPLPSEGGGD